MIVRPFTSGEIETYLGESIQAGYIVHYLSELGAKTIVVEEKYIDKDYLIDYSKFYSRSFESHPRFTKRIHFFTGDFTETDLKRAFLEKDGLKHFQEICEKYLGFSIVKPITDSMGNPLIGRTLLSTYPPEDNSDKRIFISQKYPVSLYGVPLTIDSLPFQAQDQGVSACATIALWSALHPLHSSFETPRHSPVEITEISSLIPSKERNFPSEGLNLNQITSYIKSIGLDIETLKAESDVIPVAVKAYINAKLPILATLELKRAGKESGYHAAVISGYRCNENNELLELYVHDDQIGPYSRVISNNNFISWNNEWKTTYGQDEVILKNLIIPVYPKIRLTFGRIHSVFLRKKQDIEKEGYIAELFLTQVNEYKKTLLNLAFEEKERILTSPMPRFIWIIRAHINNIPIFDEVYDGTSVYPKKVQDIDTIEYQLSE
ncbi:hypothetical protein DRP07_07830 [Archaeoglobales archaeon]|nr:MAG: hypothetical protein DRP07_07830 [Archaeoglobales archaeon]